MVLFSRWPIFRQLLVVFFIFIGTNGVQGLVLGAVGGVTETSAIVAFRTDSAIATVRVEYSTNSGFAGSTTSSASVATASSSDFTGQITLSGLQSNTVYYYRILENGTPQSAPYTQQFQTFPSTGGSFSFVVFADAANNDRSAPAYASAAATSPLLAM